jgi:predicted outer membrane repeat protein
MFTHNYNQYGGGGFAAFYSAPALEHCVFWDNESELSGGGMHIGIAPETDLGEFSLRYCVFSENVAGISGGGLLIGGTDGIVERCVFRANSARDGGAIYFGQNVSASITQTTMVDNSAERGAGIWLYSNATALIGNTIVAFNTGGAAVDCDSLFGGPSEATMSCCDVFGNDGGDWVDCLDGQLGTKGNIREDPLFCDRAAGNLLLQSGSPCVNDSCGVIGMYNGGCATAALRRQKQ